MTYANINIIDWKSLSSSSVQYNAGNSAQLCQSSPKLGHCLMQCAAFFVSIYAALCHMHVTWRPDPAALPVNCCLDRWLFARNYVIANGVLRISEVRRSCKIQSYQVYTLGASLTHPDNFSSSHAWNGNSHTSEKQCCALHQRTSLRRPLTA